MVPPLWTGSAVSVRKARVVVDAYCDVCNEMGENIESYVVLAFKGTEVGVRKARVVDLCGPCAGRSVEPAMMLMKATRKAVESSTKASTPDDGGQAEPKPRYQTPDWNCPRCYRTLKRNSAVDHLVKVHGASKMEQPERCPDCGKAYGDATIMGMHRSNRHGFSMIQAHLDQITPKAKAKHS